MTRLYVIPDPDPVSSVIFLDSGFHRNDEVGDYFQTLMLSGFHPGFHRGYGLMFGLILDTGFRRYDGLLSGFRPGFHPGFDIYCRRSNKCGFHGLFLCIIMSKERSTRRQKDISRLLREKKSRRKTGREKVRRDRVGDKSVPCKK